MQPPARLPLLKSAFRLLVDRLRAEDRVAIVVYAGAAGLALPPTSGADKQTIIAALDRLEAGGSTAGAQGIQLAYDVAKQNFIDGGNNRVILATDGDFNVGITSHDDLLQLIEQRRDDGVYLTTLGVGDDNYSDARMEMLADHGNGNYAYLDNLKEAEKVFVRELTGTLVTIAKDVKVQLEFNPALVQSYRQIGYEDRALANKDFDDDTKDAGELGAGHSVTALYEIVPATSARGRVASLRLRYKQPAGTTSELITAEAIDDGRNIHEASPDLQFASAVAEFGMTLRHSKDKGTSSYADALALARASRGVDLDGTREEFLRLVESSRAISGAARPIASRD
jgi:Ca-activated chloride channel homolog